MSQTGSRKPLSDDMLAAEGRDSPAAADSGHASDADSSSAPASAATEPPSDPSSKRMPSLRSVSDPRNMNPSSTPLGLLGKARHPVQPPTSFAGGATMAMNNSVMAKARALHQQRMQKGMTPTMSSPSSPVPSPSGSSHNGFPLQRPGPGPHIKSSPAIANPSLGERRGAKPGPAMRLSDMGAAASSPGLRRLGAPKLSDMGGAPAGESRRDCTGPPSKLDDFKQYIDTEKGWITFDGAATITRTGVNFANGNTFTISLDEVQILDELGKGNYGTVYKVKHAKPAAPRFGPGLSGRRLRPTHPPGPNDDAGAADAGAKDDGTTGQTMAMKEIRLELDDAKFTTILKELVILHECVSPYIIDFFGAFFQEGAVYMCIEYMDGGSVDKLYDGGVPENILRKITYSTVMGLKSLKDDHNIIHRDVKPTNILVNTRGQVKICDFGVSGNLVASIAKTNIGCQSYMAPERISGGGSALSGNADGTYSVQSDVWSLGLTIIECALGRYPYPPEVSSTIFGQLNAIVEGEPPDMPEEGYSNSARDFVRSCLHKKPKMRPTYAMLLKQAWLQPFSQPAAIAEAAEEGDEAEAMADAVGKLELSPPGTEDGEVADWVKSVLRRKHEGRSPDGPSRPALHGAPLDMGSGTSPQPTAPSAP